MNTTTDTNKAFADAMKQELAIYAKLARKRYDEAQAKLLADVRTNPISAITWSAEDLVKAQAEHEVWLNEKVPFGVVSLTCKGKSEEWSGEKGRSLKGTVESTKRIAVSAMGSDAQSELPTFKDAETPGG